MHGIISLQNQTSYDKWCYFINNLDSNKKPADLGLHCFQ